MTRRMLTALMATMALAAPAAAQAQTTTPSLGVKLTACDDGPTLADNSAVFEGSLPASDDATRLGMNFELSQRTDGSDDFKRLKVPNFGIWQKSDPGVPGFVVDKRIVQLQPGADYRVTVKFRWYAKSGKVLRTARRVSAICAIDDLRPDLSIRNITTETAPDGGSAIYRVLIRNLGLGAIASPFAVSLSVGGQTLAPGQVSALGAGAGTTVSFSGPPCTAGASIQAVADPSGAIDEVTESDNSYTRPCAQS